jgi:hypothetical protein
MPGADQAELAEGEPEEEPVQEQSRARARVAR